MTDVKKKKKNKEVIEDTRIKVYGYCRVSTQMQYEDGLSILAQIDKIKNYCALKNFNLIDVFQESCSGGVSFNERPMMKQLLQNIHDGKASGLVVAKLDRFSRKMKDIILQLAHFEEEGIHFMCCEPELDSSTTTGKFTLHILSALSELERATIRDRVNEVMRWKKSQNHCVGSIPFGYDVEVQNGTKILIPNEREQALITRIKEMRKQKVKIGNGKERPMSFILICQQLEKEKILNKNGTCNWFPAQIRRIVHDGDYKSGKKSKVNDEDEDSDDEESD